MSNRTRLGRDYPAIGAALSELRAARSERDAAIERFERAIAAAAAAGATRRETAEAARLSVSEVQRRVS